MRVLVIGGTSFFGYATVLKLAERGHKVTVFTRGRRQPPLPEDVVRLTGDRTHRSGFRKRLGDVSFDAVFDNIAYDREDVTSALQALVGNTRHYVLTSSAAVYLRPETSESLSESEFNLADGDLNPRGNPSLAYAVGKINAERALWESDGTMPFTIIRPPVVTGPRDPSLRAWFWIQRVSDGGPMLLPDGGTSVFRQVYSEDLAETIVSVLANPAAFGKAYNVAQAETVTLRDYVSAIAQALGKDPKLVEVPLSDLKEAGLWPQAPPFVRPRRLVLDISAAERDLGYVPTPFPNWIAKTARWFVDVYRGQDSMAYGGRDREIRLAESRQSLQGNPVSGAAR